MIYILLLFIREVRCSIPMYTSPSLLQGLVRSEVDEVVIKESSFVLPVLLPATHHIIIICDPLPLLRLVRLD